jgi:hypothetical protein
MIDVLNGSILGTASYMIALTTDFVSTVAAFVMMVSLALTVGIRCSGVTKITIAKMVVNVCMGDASVYHLGMASIVRLIVSTIFLLPLQFLSQKGEIIHA